MNEITSYQSAQLPDTLDDLSRFVLVNEERVQALKAQIRAIKKVSLAKEVYEQKLAEAQEIGQITVEAAQKMGELLLQIQKQQGKRNDLSTSVTNSTEVKTKTQITEEMGMNHKQVIDYQQMALNPESVQIAIQKAIENGDVVSRTQVMKEIAEAKRKAKTEAEEENNRLRSALSESETRRIQAEQTAKETVKEVIKEVEVVPSDYDDLKKKADTADAYKKDFKNMQSEYKKMAEKWKMAESEKDNLIKKMKEPETEKAENIKRSALFFCAGVSNFIEKYGGYIWLTQEIDTMDKADKEGYIRAINAIDAWVQQMKSNLGE